MSEQSKEDVEKAVKLLRTALADLVEAFPGEDVTDAVARARDALRATEYKPTIRILVTGVTGSGKSAVSYALRKALADHLGLDAIWSEETSELNLGREEALFRELHSLVGKVEIVEVNLRPSATPVDGFFGVSSSSSSGEIVRVDVAKARPKTTDSLAYSSEPSNLLGGE